VVILYIIVKYILIVFGYITITIPILVRFRFRVRKILWWRSYNN